MKIRKINPRATILILVFLLKVKNPRRNFYTISWAKM